MDIPISTSGHAFNDGFSIEFTIDITKKELNRYIYCLWDYDLIHNDIIKKYPEDIDLLEDVIVENKQAIEMANIYSGILSGTMDAFASVISNNLNIVMKVLSVITIVLSIPTLIFSAFGMNLNLPFAENPFGFLIVVVGALVISLTAMVVFMKSKMLK